MGTMRGSTLLAAKTPPWRPVTASGEAEGGKTSGRAHEDLAYRIELWDHSQASVEQVLAVTASAGIGFAAYYKAVQEFPDRTITLRHKNNVVVRWIGQKPLN